MNKSNKRSRNKVKITNQCKSKDKSQLAEFVCETLEKNEDIQTMTNHSVNVMDPDV